jgi:cytochrome oxidase Cu insertion factor (SCO1/SenC/PrrC family)
MNRLRGFLSCIVVVGALGCASSPQQPSTAPVDAAPATGIAVGNLAPEFSLADSEGRTVRLSDFRGKVVLLEFSAMW